MGVGKGCAMDIENVRNDVPLRVVCVEYQT
jgi:hypothetical protein